MLKEILEERSGFLSTKATAKVSKIIVGVFNKLPEKRQKFVLGLPGIKGNVNASISPVYKQSARIVVPLRDTRKRIRLDFDFDYIGLGNHPANRSVTDLYLYLNGDDIYLSNTESNYGSFDAKVKIDKKDKEFLTYILN